MSTSSRLGAALLFISAALPAAAPAAAAKTLDYTDLRKVVSVREPQISANGAAVVFVRSKIDWKGDKRDTDLVFVRTDGSEEHALTQDREDVSMPRWSPDGTRVAFLAQPAKKKPTQLYVLRMDGGDAQQITHGKGAVESFAWRPDSRALAYVEQEKPTNEDAIKHHLDAVTITDNDYLTQEAPQPSHLWLVNADGSHDARLNNGDWSVARGAEPRWSPDGSAIYYQRQPNAVFASFVKQTTYVYAVATGGDAPLGYSVDTAPEVSPDGKMLAVLAPRHGTIYLQNDLYVRAIAGGAVRYSSLKLDRNVHSAAWLPGSDGLILATDDRVRSMLWRLAPDGSFSAVDLGAVDAAPNPSIAKNGAIAFVGLTAQRPAEIYVVEPGAAPKRLTDENAWIAAYDVPRSEEVRWPIDGGMTAYGVLTYPNGYVAGRKYPLVLDIHGGPISTSTRNFSGVEGGGVVPLLAARGFLVLRPNYRGSDNENDAFLQAIVGDMASGPGRDNLAAVEAVRKMGIVDASRIGVSGWSGGGLQTSWLIGHASFWRAAVSGAAVNDQFEQAMLSDINEPFNQAFFPGANPFSPSGRAKYDEQSPITYVANVKTPTLILSDTRDQRVPVPQAYEFYHALKARGVDVQFVAFPRAGHFPTDPVGQERVLRHWVGWFERWMK